MATQLSISRERYEELRRQGLSKDQIIELDRAGQAKEVKNFLSTAAKITGGVFGGSKVGEAIGTEIAKFRATPEERKFIEPGPSKKEVFGSTLRSAALFTPVGKIGQGAQGALTASGAAPGVAKAIAPIAAGATGGFAFDVASDLEKDKPLSEAIKPGVGTAIGAAIPAVGVASRLVKNFLGEQFKGAGQKVQETVIKPSRADLADGFDVNNIKKYNLGGSLKSSLQKTDDLLDDLSNQLNNKIKDASPVDLNKVYQQTADEIATDKARAFGGVQKVQNQLDNLKGEILAVSDNGIVDAPTAQTIKRQSGLMGAWKYGAPDPDSTAQEKVFTAFYRNLKKALENVGGPEVQEINKKMSEIIPIQHAIIRRIPVAQRNQAIGLSDIMTLSAATVEPSALLLTIANRASKSGRVGEFLVSLGDNLLEAGIPRPKLEQALQAAEKAILSGITSQEDSVAR